MITEYINTHQAEFWIILGFVLLSIEVATGLVTGLLLFGGLGAIVTGLLMLTGLLHETWQTGIASTAISAGIVAVLLWKPLKNLQNDDVPKKDNSSDLVGYEFTLQQDISRTSPGSTRYSGIAWKVELDPSLEIGEMSAGQRVSVSSVEVGKFFVRPV